MGLRNYVEINVPKKGEGPKCYEKVLEKSAECPENRFFGVFFLQLKRFLIFWEKTNRKS